MSTITHFFLKKHFGQILISIILIIFGIGYIATSMSIPVDGDGALHAGTVEVITKTGTLIDFHPYTITDGTTLLPIFYPKLFYTEMAILALFIGKSTYQIIVPTFGVLIGLMIFLLSKLLFKSITIAILSSIVALSSYGLSTNSIDMFRMETMVVFLFLGSVYSLIRFTEKKYSGWFICSILLLSASIATKQQTYMYLPIFFLIIFNKFNGTIKTKFLITIAFYSLSFLIATPLLVKEFLSTGTLFYPGIPLIGGIEKHIADLFHIKLYSVGEGWTIYGIGSDRISRLKELYSIPYNHLLFLNPFYVYPSEINSSPQISYFYLPLLLIGSIYSIIRKHYFLVIFLILQQLLLFIQPLERYFVLNQILASLIVGSSMGILEMYKSQGFRFIKTILMVSVVVFSAISITLILSKSFIIQDYSYGNYVPGRLKAEEKAGNWLKNNSPLDSTLITPRTHVFSYYAERKALWINQLGGKDIYEAFLNNDIENIYKISKQYHNTYIIIPKYWVTDDAHGKWVSFIGKDTVSSIENNTEYFKNVYSDQLVKIYKTK